MRRLLPYILTLLLPLSAWSQTVRFTPQWSAQAQFAGFYAALEQGFYADAGLEVEIIHPSQTHSALDMFKSGECDIITLDLLTAICENANLPNPSILNILQTSQRSGLTIISNKSLEGGLSALEGLKVGRWRAGYGILAKAAFDQYGVDVEWIDFKGSVNLFLSGAIDATLAMSYNEELAIAETGYIVPPESIIFLSEIGFDLPEEGIYTWRTTDPDIARRFAEASKRGWLWVNQNREQSLEMVMRWIKREKIPTNRVHQRAMLNEVLRLQYNANEERSMTLDNEAFDKAVDILYRNNAIPRRVDYNSFIQ